MLKVYFFKIKKNHHQYLEKLLQTFPLSARKRILQFDRTEDQLRSATGKLLLKKLLMEEKYPANVLSSLILDKHERPYIPGKIDFNIAHSDKYVICAISKNGRIGVDIEKVRPIKIDEFNVFLSKSELKQVLKNKKPLKLFFELWTQKEAVSKANGKGIGVLLPKVKVKKNTAFCENEKWILAELNFNKKYVSHLAFRRQTGLKEIVLSQIKMKDLLKISQMAVLLNG
jgi:4'-phosphopantetheinyl transferase